ncbi:hypothetical protein [Actinoplanes teichomyceticus]|uniref:Uncharacterized protein n=1 Tax=Actinoplanes teichomyceticus TaxID=1867 RepID=A0A561VI37_ACTTI|nr:hypothetical protein [Actinoplanes teichomyceticus]TWG11288.1 hypothetical protein FHX34_10618 [Actinoplanes teichomyceticus]GIF16320.1 hypothetical protein Ate01nite_63520 [Actinoplanes teichomyceticus]
MRYVKISRGRDGNTLDATGYLDALGAFAERLPPGARAFATDPQHYDLFGGRCVKDLKPVALTLGDGDGDGDGRAWAELRLQHHCWKHEEDLTIRYSGVRSVVADPDGAETDVRSLRDVMLDEVLPHGQGCSHEIAFLAGSMTIVADDLVATWDAADCADRQALSRAAGPPSAAS